LLRWPSEEDTPMQAKKTLPKLIQEAIDKGATTVEEIHKSIVDLPLKVLEEKAEEGV
jgi:hypothetical protein